MTPDDTALVEQAEKYVAAARPGFAAEGFINGLIGTVRALAGEVERLKESLSEAEFTDALCDRLAELIKQTCDALKGPPPELTTHSAHDLPEVAAALSAEVAALRASVKEWGCEKCNYVYPGPPQQGFKCITCPRCGGSTMPLSLMKQRAAEREVAALKAGHRIAVTMHDTAEQALMQAQKEVAALQALLREAEPWVSNCDEVPSEIVSSIDAALADKPRFTDGRGNSLDHLVDKKA